MVLRAACIPQLAISSIIMIKNKRLSKAVCFRFAWPGQCGDVALRKISRVSRAQLSGPLKLVFLNCYVLVSISMRAYMVNLCKKIKEIAEYIR